MRTKAFASVEFRILTIYNAAITLCDSHGGGSRLLEESVLIAAKQEREHRSFGHRLLEGRDIGPRVSVVTAARYFALKGFVEPARFRRFDDREDFVRAYGAASRFQQPENRRAYLAFCRKYRAEIQAMEYPTLESKGD